MNNTEKNINRYPDKYDTYDLGCAAYLVAKGWKIDHIEKIEGSQRKVFYFEREAMQDGVAYWNDEGLINPREFSNSIRDLKTKIYND